MKKILLVLGLFLLIVFILSAIRLMTFFEKNFSIKKDASESFSLEIKDENRGMIKNIVNATKNLLYRGATKYNPEGDAFPDEIDNKIKEDIKKKIN